MFGLFKKTKPKFNNNIGFKTKSGNYQTATCISHQYEYAVVPECHFKDVHGMHETKQKIIQAVKEIRASWTNNDVLRKNGVLLYGEPGNGKTMFAQCIAGSYKIPYFEITAANITSQYIGETPRAIKESFDFVKRNSPCVLMLDEVDALISELDKNSTSDKRDVRSTLLTELVEIRKFPIFVVAGTNYFDKLDPASIREGRFDYKIEVSSPDLDARIALLKRGINSSKVNPEVLSLVAKRYAGFNSKRIINIASEVKASAGNEYLTVGHFSKALRKIQGASGNTLRNVPGLDQLAFNEEMAHEVDDLVSELKLVDHLVTHNTDPFKGALFFGPAGTGKTALAKAIAKESGWAFLDTTGPDLISDFEKFDQLYKKAKALRPCVIFIDEASELISERTTSRHSVHTNKLLTVIDGFGESIPDVVFIAATNHGDNVDEAVARRLYRKIYFELPNAETTTKLLRIWSEKNPTCRTVIENSISMIVEKLVGMSAANMISSLDTAYKKSVLDAIKTGKKPELNVHYIK